MLDRTIPVPDRTIPFLQRIHIVLDPLLILVRATDGHRTIVRCLHRMRIVCRVHSRCQHLPNSLKIVGTTWTAVATDRQIKHQLSCAIAMAAGTSGTVAVHETRDEQCCAVCASSATVQSTGSITVVTHDSAVFGRQQLRVQACTARDTRAV